MISQETIQRLATEYQTPEFPNIVREYFQHVVLAELYKLSGAAQLLFKGGTALRIIYGSPRFSEDLDFSLFRVPKHRVKPYIENLLQDILVAISRMGIAVELGTQADRTTGGYYGETRFRMDAYPSVTVAINISDRNGRNVRGEVDAIASDFIPTYTLLHLPQIEIVEEKVFRALLGRKKARDFYDLYYLLRRGMLTIEQRQRLATVKDEILRAADEQDFRAELSALLPTNQQRIIGDFDRALRDELDRV